MLNKTWRVILLIIALVTVIWPSLLGASTYWIALIAIVLLLISEISHRSHMPSAMTVASVRPQRRSARRRPTTTRRRAPARKSTKRRRR